MVSPTKERKMSRTIEQISAGRGFDPIWVLNPKAALKGIATKQRPPADILKSMLTCLSEGRIRDFVTGFQSPFECTDHALDLQFKEQRKLTEFLEKSRKLFPDTNIEVVSVFQSGAAAIAEWKLTATETESYGSISHRSRIALPGVTIIEARDGSVIRWSDYYDQLKSRRTKLGSFFEEWIEY